LPASFAILKEHISMPFSARASDCMRNQTILADVDYRALLLTRCDRKSVASARPMKVKAASSISRSNII